VPSKKKNNNNKKMMMMNKSVSVSARVYREHFYHQTFSFSRFSQSCEKRLLVSSCLSVCLSAWNNSAAIRRIFKKPDIYVFFKKCVEKFQFSLKSDKNNGTVHEEQRTVLITSRSVPRVRNVSDRNRRCNQNTHCTVS